MTGLNFLCIELLLIFKNEKLYFFFDSINIFPYVCHACGLHECSFLLLSYIEYIGVFMHECIMFSGQLCDFIKLWNMNPMACLYRNLMPQYFCDFCLVQQQIN